MDTKKLRQKILDLAIHGKLVPQDPNDEPASVLLERIRAEKERLIAEGKIKRSKKSASSDTSHYENVPFEVPEGWCWCTVDDFAYVAAGSTPSKESFVDEGIPYIKMYNLRNQKIDFDFHPQYIKEDVHNGKLQRSRTEVGDLIMNIVGPPLGKLAFIPESLPQSNFNQAAVLIRPYFEKNIINRWLFYYLSEMSEINSISTKGSAGQVNISLTQSQNMRVPMPPLAEQVRIANKLDFLWDLIASIESGIKDVNSVIANLKSKILDLAIHGKLVPQDANDEPASELLKRINPKAVTSCDNPHYAKIPSSWVWVKLGDVTNYGKCSTCSVDDINNESWILELEDIEKDTGRVLVRHTKAEREIKGVRYSFSVGNVLYSKLRTYLNKVLLAKADGFCTTEIIPIECTDVIYPQYLCYVLRSKYFLDYTAQCGYGVKMPRLSTNDARKAMIPLPPLPEQIKIIEKVESITQGVDCIARALQ